MTLGFTNYLTRYYNILFSIITSEVKNYTNNYIETRFQSNSPTDRSEPESDAEPTEPLMPYFFKKAFNRKANSRLYIILADTGMGKTAFMVNLYIRYKLRINFRLKKYNIKLFPLGDSSTLDTISKLENQTETILLLDAFDEDNFALADVHGRLEEIVQKVRNFREVIITCRTQFFQSKYDEPHETGIPRFGNERGNHTFLKFYISPFSDEDVKKYLRKKYRFYQFKLIRRAFKIIKKAPNLMSRPMLLNYIDDIVNLPNNTSTTYEIYEFLVNKWLLREASRLPNMGRNFEQQKQQFISKMLRFSEDVAWDIYKNRNQRKEYTITEDEISRLALQYSFDLSILELKSRSLLTRTSEGDYKFAHKSILDFFVSKRVVMFAENTNAISNINDLLKVHLEAKFLSFFTKEISIHKDFTGDQEKIKNFIGEVSTLTTANFSFSNYQQKCTELFGTMEKLIYNPDFEINDEDNNISLLSSLSTKTEFFLKENYKNYFEMNIDKRKNNTTNSIVEKFISKFLWTVQDFYFFGSLDLEGMDMTKKFATEYLTTIKKSV